MRINLLIVVILGTINSFGQTNTFPNSGNVGIGTTDPKYKLDVDGIIKWGGLSEFIYSGQDATGGYLEQYSQTINQDKMRFQTSKNGDEANYSQFIIDPKKGFLFYTLGGGNGNVGIGTLSPMDKLSVNGNIRSKEVKVEIVNWPDYVFEEDYKITSLESLEKFIKINKHLPEVPSAKEVNQDGLQLGEMNKILLKKVEELTLYLIEQNKILAEQQKMLEKQQKEIVEMKKKNK